MSDGYFTPQGQDRRASARAFFQAAYGRATPPVAYLWPWQAMGATEWRAWFAWLPVWTDDHGWRWFRRVFYRRCFPNGHHYDAYRASWVQYSGVKL